MNKKIFLFLLAIICTFGTFTVSVNALYVIKNETPVYFNINGNFNYLFWEGYTVGDAGENYGDFRKVYLTDGATAYIESERLAENLDSKYMLHSQGAQLLAGKFPLFLEPNAKADASVVLYKWANLEIVNSNLINKIWVRVKDQNGNIWYVWYKTLDFSMAEDNAKKNLELAEVAENSYHSEINIFSGVEFGTEDAESIDIDYQILKVKNTNYEAYLVFLEKISDLQSTDNNSYTAVLNALRLKSPSVYNDLIWIENKAYDSVSDPFSSFGQEEPSEENTDYIDFSNSFFWVSSEDSATTETQTKDPEIEALENLSTEELLRDLFQ